MIQNLEVNKKNAIEFYRIAYIGEPTKAIKHYVGAEYIQHNPDVEMARRVSLDTLKELLVNILTRTLNLFVLLQKAI